MTLQPPNAAQFAARLVVEGLLPEQTVRAVLAKQRELADRGVTLGVGDICQRKGWLTASEVRWLTAPETPPVDLLPNLRLGGLLGTGGMSRVFRAVDRATNSPLAVKILHPRLARDPAARALFAAESDLLCRLDHPHLVRGFYSHEHDGLHYLAMELVDGPTALAHIETVGTLSEAVALRITLQAAEALEYIHQQGLVHRDVKPGNVLLDRAFNAKLCDLGFAINAGAGSASGETTVGTVQYLAPEQATGDVPLDVRADIYALGVTLFQLALGKLPFEGETDSAVLARRVMEELRAKELKGAAVSHLLQYFIQKMMARDREVRYQSPAELITDIRERLAGHQDASGRVPVARPITAKTRAANATAGGARPTPMRRRI